MSTKPAPVTLTIPSQSISEIQGDPAFADLRRHHQAFRSGIAVTFGAAVAMGAEIARLRATVNPSHGGKRSKSNNVALETATPWREIVKAQAKVDHETARRTEKVATDLRQQLEGKRDKLSTRVRFLLDHPEQIQTFEDYETLSRATTATYDADTWHGILIEAGVLRRPVESKPALPEKSAKKIPLLEEARLAALAWLRSLHEPRVHRELWRKRLAALPADPTGDPDHPSLSEIRAELSDQLVEIDEILLRKASAT